MSNEGIVPSVVADPDAVRKAVAGNLGQANLAPGSLTLGKMVDGGPAGASNLRWLKLVTNGATTYNLPHKCGYVPTGFVVWSQENSNSPNTFLAVTPFERQKWSATEIRVKCQNLAGSMTGSEVWLIVGGES